MSKWDATQYLQFNKERTQPAIDLVQRIALKNPQHIIDLGCGPGNSTEVIRQHWPIAHIIGLDSSPEMIETARNTYPQGSWQIGDAASWQTNVAFDLVFSNAMLQWLPEHAQVCRHWLEQVKNGGALAVQIPAHYDSALHKEMLEISFDPAWNDRMNDARKALTHHPSSFYYDALSSLAAHIELWETLYFHVLEGPERILEWFRGTGLRPFLGALSTDAERKHFEELLLERYRIAYPYRANGKVLFPFRRLFFIAYR